MNTNLIRRLEKQCWDYQSNCVDAEKFTQLIVQECESVSISNSRRDDDMGAIIARKIKQHFGVE